MGLKNSWGYIAEGVEWKERKLQRVKCINFRLLFLKKAEKKTHKEYTAQKELFRESGEKYRLKKITDIKSLNTAHKRS